MAVSLFTSRVVLHALGVTDYGIYNVIGGIVTFFTFINSAMMAATQRFINFELGRGDNIKLKHVFKTAYIIHLLLALVIAVIGCTIGKYLLDYRIKIPVEALFSANIVLYASICTCCIQILTLPFSGDIIAHEKINIYAWISIIEVLLKLVVAGLISNSKYDRLSEYALLLAVAQLLPTILYISYCYRNFPEVRGPLFFDKTQFKEMGGFALWCIIGSMAGSFANQGIGILLGIFFVPAINAARGIAVQVQTAVASFGANLNTAMAPQITQSYASGDLDFFNNILYRGSKYIFVLMLIIAIPILIRTDYIVGVWLGEVPEYTVRFIKWLLYSTIIETISYPLMRASDASGKIKIYHSVVGGILLLILPIAYISLKLTREPVSVFQAFFVINVIAFLARLIILRSTVRLSIRKYVIQVLSRIVVISLLSWTLCYYTTLSFPNTFIGLIGSCVVDVIVILILSYLILLDKSEKIFLKRKIKDLRGRSL